MLRLAAVQIGDETGQIVRTRKRRIEVVQVVSNAFLAAGDAEQFAVQLDRPIPVQTSLPESPVEGHAVAVALRIRKCTVHIEDQRVHTHRFLTPIKQKRELNQNAPKIALNLCEC